MDAFITSTLTVALAEIGDKTQLLSLYREMTESDDTEEGTAS